MNVTEMLGLQDERIGGLVQERWAAWAAIEGRLNPVGDPSRIDAWRRRAVPETANQVMLGLERLAAIDGVNDADAASVLAWLLLPTALRVRRSLRSLGEGLDAMVAAQLWMEVRTLPWRRPHWVAAKVARNLKEAVLHDSGWPTHHQPIRLELVSLGPVDPPDDRWVGAGDPEAELSELLTWASGEDVISSEDRDLLLSLVAAAKRIERAGERPRDAGVAGLSSRQLSAIVSREWGVCPRTVRRRTARCLAALVAARHEYVKAAG